MACGDKIKKRCVVTPSSCIQYELELPGFSQLTDCVTIEETTDELYNLVESINQHNVLYTQQQ